LRAAGAYLVSSTDEVGAAVPWHASCVLRETHDIENRESWDLSLLHDSKQWRTIVSAVRESSLPLAVRTAAARMQS